MRMQFANDQFVRTNFFIIYTSPRFLLLLLLILLFVSHARGRRALKFSRKRDVGWIDYDSSGKWDATTREQKFCASLPQRKLFKTMDMLDRAFSCCSPGVLLCFFVWKIILRWTHTYIFFLHSIALSWSSFTTIFFFFYLPLLRARLFYFIIQRACIRNLILKNAPCMRCKKLMSDRTRLLLLKIQEFTNMIFEIDFRYSHRTIEEKLWFLRILHESQTSVQRVKAYNSIAASLIIVEVQQTAAATAHSSS